MNSENKVTRRAVAGRFSSDKDTIASKDGRDTSERSRFQRYRDDAIQYYTNDKKRRRSRISSHNDRERILFLALALVGAAVVAIACSTFSEEVFGNMPIGTPLKLPSFSSEKHSLGPRNTYWEKGHLEVHQRYPLHVEFNDVISIHFAEPVSNVFPVQEKRDDNFAQKSTAPEYGGLYFNFTKSGGKTRMRRIKHDPTRMISDYTDPQAINGDDDDDDRDSYYAYDDDYLRNPYIEFKKGNDDTYYDYKEPDEEYVCRRISEHRLYFPNCNSFHETSLIEAQATIIGEGAYRQAMKLDRLFGREHETIVAKDIHLWYDYGYDVYEFTRMDAIVAERLTSSNRIYNIYGACGVGILSEYYEKGNIETIAIDEHLHINRTQEVEGPLNSYNDLPPLTKLQMSLYMAEALADLHGYPGGVIVHQDVKLDQYFLNEDLTGLILNDFNRAEFMLWDENEEEYCMYTEGYGRGNWRSPEEYRDQFLNEKVDVFSLGNNIYGLLTGLMVFHESETYEETQERVANGEKAFIDPRYKERSLAEAKLVEIIEKCHEYYPEDRPSIFEVVELLLEALEEVYEAMDNSESGLE